MGAQITHTTKFEIDGIIVPVKIKQESRGNIRYSISKGSANLTVPRHYPKELILKEIGVLEDWCKNQFLKNPKLINRFRIIHYTNNEFIRVYGKDFKLLIFEAQRNSFSIQIKEEHYIEIKVPKDVDEHQKQMAIGKLLSRALSNYFHQDISDRVNYFNETFFKEEILSIKLKNNKSNWGSCSSNKAINLSSRLLFAPRDVIDYVIVHELAHLKEMNHSKRFWDIVKGVMPNFKEKEEWLATHGHTLKY